MRISRYQRCEHSYTRNKRYPEQYTRLLDHAGSTQKNNSRLTSLFRNQYSGIELRLFNFYRSIYL